MKQRDYRDLLEVLVTQDEPQSDKSLGNKSNDRNLLGKGENAMGLAVVGSPWPPRAIVSAIPVGTST
jgi:hypothetical protein